MQVNINHLMKRGNTYYFRTRVPSELIDTFGCREIKRSLKTNDLHKAELTRYIRPKYASPDRCTASVECSPGMVLSWRKAPWAAG